jgi:hypothetical protein
MPAASIFRFIHVDRVSLCCHAIELYLTMQSISVHILKKLSLLVPLPTFHLLVLFDLCNCAWPTGKR